jgi:hypothetical protein
MAYRKAFAAIVAAAFLIGFSLTVTGCAGGTGSSKRSAEDVPTAGPGTGGGGTGGGGTGGGTGGGSAVPSLGGSSGGSGGQTGLGGSTVSAGGVSYNLIVPSSPPSPAPFLLVYSGVEGGATMTSNLLQMRQMISGMSSFIIAVLDGRSASSSNGATVIDDVRSKYNVDNDKTYLLSESAGTASGLKLGFDLRQSYFAAYWVNDVNCSYTPQKNASQLGFAPHGNAGPGGDWPDANAIVNGMSAAGYRLPADAPYSGAGSGSHGDPNQFIAALGFFPGKSRK